MLFKASIVKGLTTDPRTDADWSNVYTIEADGPEAAMATAGVLVNAEKDLHSEEVFFKRIILRDPSKTFHGRTFELGGDPGVRTPGTNPLPLWNVVRILGRDLDFSRPEVKYYRLPIYEEDHTGANLSGALLTLLGDFTDELVLVSGLVGGHGETITSWTADETIKMRQTDWHRKSRPGFKRGYVPV